MALWRKRHTETPAAEPDPAAAAELQEAGQRQAAATASSWRRAPVYAEAERLRRSHDGIYDDLMRSLELRGHAS